MNKFLLVMKELIPFLILFVLQTFIHSEIIFFILALVVILLDYYIKQSKNEWKLFLVGAFTGFIIEVVMGLIYRSQFWENASLLGVPLWLPLTWGYGFLVITRVGNIITNEGNL